MSTHLRPSDARWFVLCDRVGCMRTIVADEGTHEAQHKQLPELVKLAGWYRALDIGDLCTEHAVDAPMPIVPREELCQLSAWCLLRHGHSDECKTKPKREIAASDFGPEATKRRRY